MFGLSSLPGAFNDETGNGRCAKRERSAAVNTTVLLADDHAMLRGDLRRRIDAEPDIAVVAEAADGRSALALAGVFDPDIVVGSVGMPDLDGAEATRGLLESEPERKVIALSVYGDRRSVRAILEAGASAYLLKSAAPRELVRAIRAVQAGEPFLSQALLPSRCSTARPTRAFRV